MEEELAIGLSQRERNVGFCVMYHIIRMVFV